jgi:hypothetical protein
MHRDLIKIKRPTEARPYLGWPDLNQRSKPMAEAILTLSQALDRAKAGEPIAPLNDNGMTEQEVYDLEGLIDRRGIQMVLQQISEIYEAKADHIAHNWQDTILAKRWATLEGALGVASTKATGL